MTFRKSSQALLIFWVSALALCAASSHSSIWNLRLRGGHRQGCTCGDRGDESEQGLFDAIRLDACCSMNTDSGHDIHAILRPECEMEDPSRNLISSDDDQVLLFIPFTELVNIKSIRFTGLGDTRVKELRAFANLGIADFDHAEAAVPHAEWLVEQSTTDAQVKVEVPATAARAFQQVKVLTLFVTASHGGDVTSMGWLGITGQRTHMKLKSVVENAEYELRPKQSLQTSGLPQGPHQSSGF